MSKPKPVKTVKIICASGGEEKEVPLPKFCNDCHRAYKEGIRNNPPS
ncbi:MAG: hypothetical protein ABSF63_12950 [Candidatus Bathyarchaeia archaeon]|jgi:hypothetical protein